MRKKVKLVQGVGINDSDSAVYKNEHYYGIDGKKKQRLVWKCPYYKKWESMLERVYSSKHHKRNPTYKECSVYKDWLYFSKFRQWVEEQGTFPMEKYHLDKDVLVRGNKMYSPKTCVFIRGLTNTFIEDNRASRGKYLIGVSFEKTSTLHPFVARCNDPYKRRSSYLGSYATELEAHLAWKSKKHEYAQEVAEYEAEPRVKEALRERYSGV